MSELVPLMEGKKLDFNSFNGMAFHMMYGKKEINQKYYDSAIALVENSIFMKKIALKRNSRRFVKVLL